MGALKEEVQFYNDNKDSILSKHRDKYVVIVGKRVIGSYNSYSDAVIATVKSHKMGTFLVRQATEEEEVAIFSRVVK